MVSKLQLFSIYSFLHVLLDSHKKFHVGKELTKIIFLLLTKCIEVLSSWMDSKDLFHTIETNPHTLKHLVSREINGFHHHPIDANCKLCFELVVEKILEILGYCKVGNTHLGNSGFPNRNQEEIFHSWNPHITLWMSFSN